MEFKDAKSVWVQIKKKSEIHAYEVFTKSWWKVYVLLKTKTRYGFFKSFHTKIIFVSHVSTNFLKSPWYDCPICLLQTTVLKPYVFIKFEINS